MEYDSLGQYWCMPQGERTREEALEFSRMLPEINLLYIGCSVLIIQDNNYMSRLYVRAHIAPRTHHW